MAHTFTITTPADRGTTNNHKHNGMRTVEANMPEGELDGWMLAHVQRYARLTVTRDDGKWGTYTARGGVWELAGFGNATS